MGGLSGKKKRTAPDSRVWASVTGEVAATLWNLTQTEPRMLAGAYARVVLTDEWNITVAADRREPGTLLGSHDVCYVFLREDQAALNQWVNELKSNTSLVPQQIATEEYAKTLVRVLMAHVEVIE